VDTRDKGDVDSREQRLNRSRQQSRIVTLKAEGGKELKKNGRNRKQGDAGKVWEKSENVKEAFVEGGGRVAERKGKRRRERGARKIIGGTPQATYP